MAVALPLFAAVLLFAAHWRRDRQVREALVDAAIVWGLLVVFSLEGLSLFHALRPAPVAIFWTGACVASAVWLWSRRAPVVSVGAVDPRSAAGRVLVTGLSFLALILLIVALVAPPNTFDVLTYHMPRVLFWIQNQSVEHFPTHNSRQVESPPFAEYVITTFQLLCGSDRLANVGQWFALIAAASTASLLARRLGATARGELFAAVACATLAPAVVEATGAKNDNVVAFWTLCATLRLLDLASGPAWRNTLPAGAAIGLAMLTKGTFYFFGWPVVAVLSGLALRRHRTRALAPLTVAAAIALAINVPHFIRTCRSVGDIFGGPITHRSIENTRYAPWVVFSNAVRTLASQSATPSQWVNQHLLYDPTVRLHQWLGLGPNHASITNGHFDVLWANFHDDPTTAGLHVPLAVACLVICLLPPLRRRHPIATLLAAALIVSFLTFCLLITWQAWHGRYLIVLFALCSPLIGLCLGRAPRLWGYAVAFLLLALALPHSLLIYSRPVLARHNIFNTPRDELYVPIRPDLLPAYRQAARLVADTGATEVGLLSDYDARVYPLQLALNEAFGHPVRLDYLNGFHNRPPDSMKVRTPAREPTAGDVVLVLPWWQWGFHVPAPKSLVEDGTGTRVFLAADFGPVSVFTRAAADQASRKIFFETGWTDVARRAGDHWSATTPYAGQFILTRLAPGTLVLTGQLTAALPSRVTVKLNGDPVTTLTLTSHDPQPFFTPLSLIAGDNVIDLISDHPPTPSSLTLTDASLAGIPLDPVPPPKSP